MYDSRGVDLNRMREGLEEISSWMSDGVRHYQPCSRTEDNAATIPQIGCQLSSARFTPRPVNCAVLVVNLAETAGAFKKGDLKPLQAIRDLFRCSAIKKSSDPLFLSIYFGPAQPSPARPIATSTHRVVMDHVLHRCFLRLFGFLLLKIWPKENTLMVRLLLFYPLFIYLF